MKEEFWKSWKNKTKQEEAAVRSLKIARKLIIQNIPKEEIIAIYAKGSFVRREMNEKSDVDTSTIVKHSKSLAILKQLQKKYREAYEPNIEFTGYSLWELKNNKRAASGKKDRAAPSRAMQHLDHYKLIYGKPLEKEKFASGTDIGHLQGMIGAFNRLFIPGYVEGKMGFTQIAKQVFFLIENEQKVRGNKPPYSFKGLAQSVKDKDHIVHDALKIRLHPTKDKKIRAKFISKLKRYLKELKKLT